MKRAILPILLAACSNRPLPGPTLPALAGEVVVFDRPIAGGAATAKLEIAPLQSGAAPADYHFEAQIRYAQPLLGGRTAGDFVPYLDVTLKLVNLETGADAEIALPVWFGVAEGWHYANDVDLDGAIGLSEAAYEAELIIARGAGVVVRSDLAGAQPGTFLGEEPIEVEGFFTLEELAAAGAPETEAGEKKPARTPKMGYGY